MEMKKTILCAAMLAAMTAAAESDFDRVFYDGTLKLDYILAGNDSTSAIYLDEMSCWDGWAGRRRHMQQPMLAGNGGITMCDHATGDTLYTNTFSTLFQEWQTTPEAREKSRSYEATCLVPYPKQPADVTVHLSDNRGRRVAQTTHTVDPLDILIRRLPSTPYEQRVLRRSGSPRDMVDIAIVGEGYTEVEKEKFFDDAARANEALFSHEPFASLADRFNVVAVATVSAESGPSVPRESEWHNTLFGAHYDTFYYDRYLTTNAIHKVHESVAGVPYEHVIMLVNTPIYGGGGFYNMLTVVASDHPTFKPVLVHEFGHAYGGLADEYYSYDDGQDQYPLDVEPWEPNITTLTHFERKWADMIDEDTPVPTPPMITPPLSRLDLTQPDDAALLKALTQKTGVYEGAGYKPHGVYRPAQECRMKNNDVEHFCPVCTRAIKAITDYYTR